MMSREQFLLVKIMEEAAELSQVASKCIQFGFENEHNSETNQTRFTKELLDLMAVLNMLADENPKCIDKTIDENEHQTKKMAKIEQYYQYSKTLGKL